MRRIAIIGLLAGLPLALNAQVTLGGLMDLELRVSGSDSKPYVNGSPSAEPTLYFPNARIFVDAPIDESWAFFAVLQSDHYGSKSPHPPFFSLMQVSWTPSDADIAFHAGRIIIPFGLSSERFLSSENPLRHLPMSHEWTTRVDKKAGLIRGPRNYTVAPGLTFVYNRLYTHGIAVQGSLGNMDAHIALAQNAPSGFNDGGEYTVPALIGRLGWRPAAWARIAASFGHGAYMRDDPLNHDAISQAGRESLTQTLYGADLTVEHGFGRVSYEYMNSLWKTVEIDRSVAPAVEVGRPRVPAEAHSLEAAWDVSAWPGLYAAARFDRMSIKRHAAVRDFQRLEAGFGYRFNRSVRLKATYAKGWNEGADLSDDVFGIQLSLRF